MTSRGYVPWLDDVSDVKKASFLSCERAVPDVFQRVTLETSDGW